MAERIQTEFSRQAGPMSASAAFHAPPALERLVAAVRGVSPDRALDLACGPGIVAEAVAPFVTELHGVDGTPEMVRRAQARFAARGLANGRFQVAWAEALPFENAAFDAVVTRLSFHHFPDLGAVLAEARRVLRPGGHLVVADVTSPEDPREAALHNALERLRDPTHVGMLPPSRLREALRRSGFVLGAEDTWTQERSFAEWAEIVADPARTGPLREVMAALARGGQGAGVGLREEAGEVRFTHTWWLAVWSTGSPQQA